MNVMAWATLSIFYFLGNPVGTGYIPYAVLAGCALIAYIEPTVSFEAS
jgi:hypothetical protein